MDQGSYKVKSEYVVTYDGKKNVVKVDSKEVVSSSDEAVLDQFEETVKAQLDQFEDVKYYDFSIDRKKGELIEKININYAKMDVDKFLSLNPTASSMFENGKVKYDTIISVYKSLGAKCEE